MAESTRGQILKNPEILGNSTEGGKLIIFDGGDTNSITLKSPDTLSASYTLVLPADDGTTDQYLKTDGTGGLSWSSLSAPAAGSNTQVQYNNSGVLAGSSGLIYNSGTSTLTATNIAGDGAALTNVKANGYKITVGTTQPTSPSVNDIWIDTN